MDQILHEIRASASNIGRHAVHQVRENVLPRLEQELRDNIVPKLEQKGEEWKERLQSSQSKKGRVEKNPRERQRGRRRPRPPSNTDLVYLTDRFLVSSKPAVDNYNGRIPSFLDTGRDARKKMGHEQKIQNRQNHQRGKVSRPKPEGKDLELMDDFVSKIDSRSNGESDRRLSHHSILEEGEGIEESSLLLSENPQDSTVMSSSASMLESGKKSPVESNAEEETKRSRIMKLSDTLSAAIRSPLPASPFPSPAISKKTRSETSLFGASDSKTRSELDKKMMLQHDPSPEIATPLTKNITTKILAVGSWEGDSTEKRLPTIPSVSLFPSMPKISANLSEEASLSAIVSPEGAQKEDSDRGTDDDSFYSTREDDTKSVQDQDSRSSSPEPSSVAATVEASMPTHSPSSVTTTPTKVALESSPVFNSPGTMVTHLDKEHGREHYLAISLAKEKPDDRTLLLFRRQIVPMGIDTGSANRNSRWSPCCVERSETPSIQHVLKICYAIHAYLQFDPKNVILTYCDNGKTRTAIVAACYLRFANLVATTEEGFRYFLKSIRKRRKLLFQNERQTRKKLGPILTAAIDTLMEDHDHEAENAEGGDSSNPGPVLDTKAIVDKMIDKLPPSIRQFFEQFDQALLLGGFLNRKPLLLRAITLQGIPVEEQPCLDIWDSSQRHIYSSHHPTLTTKAYTGTKSTPPKTLLSPSSSSQWIDEEGFYKINVVLDGDFLILCQFGGASVSSDDESHRRIHDPSKLLFRYTNTTGFLSGGYPNELGSKQVDLMRLYANHLDDEDFLVTLLFEADWEQHPYDTTTGTKIRSDENDNEKYLSTRTTGVCGKRIWRSHEKESYDEGWKVIFEHHSARPKTEDLHDFRTFGGKALYRECPDHLITVCLQLTNYDYLQTAGLLFKSPMFSWWRHNDTENVNLNDLNSNDSHLSSYEYGKAFTRNDNVLDDGNSGTTKSYLEIQREATKSVLSILDTVDITSNLEDSDQVDFEQLQEKDMVFHQTPQTNHKLDSARGHENSLGYLCMKETGFLVPSILYPHRGDISRSFSKQRVYQQRQLNDENFRGVPLVNMPRLPYFPTNSHKMLPAPSKYLNNQHRLAHLQGAAMPSNNPRLEAAKQIHSQIQHTGVTLSNLVELREIAKEWNGYFLDYNDDSINKSDEAVTSNDDGNTAVTKINGEVRESTINRDEREKKEKEWIEAQKKEAEEKLKAKLGKEQTPQQDLPKVLEEEKKMEDISEHDDNEEEEVPLKDDPDYGKYFKMLKLGMPREQVIHAFKRDGRDPKVLDLDPNRSLESQIPNQNGHEEDVLLKDNPEYSKYFKMLKMGMPREQVLHALRRDEKDATILDLDPNKTLESQLPDPSANQMDDRALKDDPEYAKYFKMLKMGMPREQVLHAFQRDGKDPRILDLDPNKSLQSQQNTSPSSDDDNEMPLKDDPEYAKYFKMLKMGMPKEQVLHAFHRDGKDPKILDLDPNKSLKSQQTSDEIDDAPTLKDDPEYSKYFKMMKMGMPKEQVLHALKRDEKDPAILDLDPNKSLKSQQVAVGGADDGLPLRDDPEYAKYFRMEKMGLPRGAVKNALVRDGKDPSIADLDPNKSLKAQNGGATPEEKDTGIPLKDDPEYTKYFKMEKMGLPRDAVRNALVRDGKDPSIIDLDPNFSVEFQMKNSKSSSGKKPLVKKKKKVRRKKIYWNPIDPSKLKKDSLWNIVRNHVAMGNLDYDQKEFEELFTESAEAGAKKQKKGPAQKEVKKAVQAIDPKRSMNGGIVLSRIKMGHRQVAEVVDRMEHNKFDATQLKNLIEYLATADERRALIAYMQKGANSEEKKEELYNDLSETEKYMVTLMEISDAEGKLRTMEFRNGFKNRFVDMTASVRTLNMACDQLRSSEKFRKLMAMILTVVNQINTGGEGNLAMGFTLDALLKLNEAKAFDKKTSVLHYVVKLVKKNDESLLLFENDLSYVIPAENVLLDTVSGDLKTLQDELTDVIKIVSKEAEKLEEAGKLPKFTLAELMEQKSIVQHVGEVPQFNKITHLTGRTSMERFAMNAKVACEQALESVENVKTKYTMILGYFGEDESMPTGDFFSILRRFMTEWKKATIQVEKIEKQQAKEKKREAKRLAKEKRTRGEKLSSKKQGVPLVPNKPAVGGIAALAAEVALKANDRPKSALPAGGIAALAAQAAFNTSKEESTKVQPKKPPVGGIAPLAAEVATKVSKKKGARLKKSYPTSAEAAIRTARKQDREETASVDIASVAAQTATKKAEKTLEEAKPMGTAAQGAKAKKRQEEAQPRESLGIAALAAQAAKKKAEKTKEEAQPVGIAALAAQAARKKAEKTKEEAQPVGIAALAAQAARKKAEKTKEEAQPVGIAALAAQAARKKAEKTKEEAQPVGIAALAAQAARKKAEKTKEEAQPVGIAALAAQAARKKAEKTKEEAQPVGIAALAAQAARKKAEKTKEEAQPVGTAALVAQGAREKVEQGFMEVPVAEPIMIAPLATQEAMEKGDQQNVIGIPQGTRPNEENRGSLLFVHRPIEPSSLNENGSNIVPCREKLVENTGPPRVERNAVNRGNGHKDILIGHQSPKITSESPTKSVTSPGGGPGAALAYQDSPKNAPESPTKSVTSPGGGLGAALAYHDSPKKVSESPTKSITSPGGGLGAALTAHDSQNKTKDLPVEPTSGLAALAALAKSRRLEAKPQRLNRTEKSPNALQNDRQPTSLGDFFELQTQTSQEMRKAILRQNYDDSSVAIIAEDIEKETMNTSPNKSHWKEGEGISDYMGWANQAIKASDTESVRGFEASRHIVDHFDYDDESTIATAFDDDASIATEALGTPRNESDAGGYYGLAEYYDSSGFNDSSAAICDPYGRQMAYGDAVISMPMNFEQDQGLNPGLSFDNPQRYASANESMNHGGYDDYGLGGFGQDTSLGAYELTSPNQSDFSAPVGRDNQNHELDRPWASTTTPPKIDGGLDKPWGGTTATPATNGEENVVFRGWGEPTPSKEPDPPKKKWFW